MTGIETMHRARWQKLPSLPLGAGYLLATATLALLAIAWRRAVVPRSSACVNPGSMDLPAVLPALPKSRSDQQTARSGTGALMHRRYELALPLVDRRADELFQLMQRHLIELAPSTLARFEKCVGHDLAFQVGDEFEITMLGPWNGRVRVAELTETSFTFVTLAGHPEAGHITFSVRSSAGDERTAIVLIESWARSRDGIVDAAYGTLGIGKQIQAEVWITFLHRLGSLAGMEHPSRVRVSNEELPGNSWIEAEVGHDA